jgi:tetratricopeptide (TPR) repeat protein
MARRWPYVVVGWLWYLATLLPVIGLIQLAGYSHADRYTYEPLIGVFVLLAWGAHDLPKRWRYGVMALSVAGSAAIVLCLVLTRQQLGHWKDSEVLFRHTLEVTEDNYLAHNNLGDALDKKGRSGEAIAQFQQAIHLQPGYDLAHNNLGAALYKKGQIDEAISQYQEAIRLKPGDAEAHNNLGIALCKKGQIDEAISQHQEAIRLKPDHADAHNNLGTALEKKGQTDEAISQYQEAIRLQPDFFHPHLALAQILPRLGRLKDAAFHIEEFLRTCPRVNLDFPNSPIRESAVGPLNDLAWFLATSQQAEDRDGVRAVRFAERACELTDRQIPVLVGTLAAAYAEAGRFKEAIETAQQARALAQAAGQAEVAEKNRQLLELYRSGKAYREPPPRANDTPGHTQ